MDTDELISKVRLNPAIWDKRIKEHSNRNIVNFCWKKISREMKTDGEALRKKWKYLRDQFCVECTKIKAPRYGGDSADPAAEPKWLHYKQMSFLKDLVRPRDLSSKLKQKATAFTDDNGEIKQEYDVSLWDDEQETDSNDLNAAEKETLNDNATENQLVLNQPATSSPSQPRKRRCVMATNTLYNEKTSQLEQPKTSTVQSVQWKPDNDDILFFKSLLPFVSKIPTEQKLRFRSRIQQVVEEFAFMARPEDLSST